MASHRPNRRHFVLALLAISVITLMYVRWLHVTNATIVALTYVLVVVLVAASSHLWVAILTSCVAVAFFNFFFLPPVGTWTIADPQNWVVLFAFLTVSLVASRLSALAQQRQHEATARRDELARLFDLSRDVLLSTENKDPLALLARFVARRFELDYTSICLPHGTAWNVFAAGSSELTLDPQQLTAAFDAGHRDIVVSDETVRLVPLRLGTKPLGLLAAAGRSVEAGTLDALAGVVAIAIERAQFLEERKGAELARQSEELKSARLASLAHDLRTPLTAIRVAASNLQGTWLTDEQRREQSDLVLAEVERLTRLFQNILEMARIDAGAILAEEQWVHPLEIVQGAEALVEHALRGHPVETHVEGDDLVRLDPRLTASALAHLLENAAQYSAAGLAIIVGCRVVAGDLSITVRDHGPGIPAGDLPRLFERFYRGGETKRRVSGTGMGLSIARGLLAAEQGRVWAENCIDGGAQFTIAVPVHVKSSTGQGMTP
jgi:two-component system sensor histidine kinase KdpD